MVLDLLELGYAPIRLAFVEIFAQFFTYTQCRKHTEWKYNNVIIVVGDM
jgi:hypothetical protein